MTYIELPFHHVKVENIQRMMIISFFIYFTISLICMSLLSMCYAFREEVRRRTLWVVNRRSSKLNIHFITLNIILGLMFSVFSWFFFVVVCDENNTMRHVICTQDTIDTRHTSRPITWLLQHCDRMVGILFYTYLM